MLKKIIKKRKNYTRGKTRLKPSEKQEIKSQNQSMRPKDNGKSVYVSIKIISNILREMLSGETLANNT